MQTFHMQSMLWEASSSISVGTTWQTQVLLIIFIVLVLAPCCLVQALNFTSVREVWHKHSIKQDVYWKRLVKNSSLEADLPMGRLLASR